MPDVARPRLEGAQARINGGSNQAGDMPSYMFKEESKREETNNRDSKKKPAQIKKNDNRATQDVKAQEGTTEGEPYLMMAEAKKSNKIHPLKITETMSRTSSEGGFNIEEKL